MNLDTVLGLIMLSNAAGALVAAAWVSRPRRRPVRRSTWIELP